MALVKNILKDYALVIRGLLQVKDDSMKKKSRVRQASEEEVRVLAYLKWEQAQDKSSEDCWLEAEKELTQVEDKKDKK